LFVFENHWWGVYIYTSLITSQFKVPKRENVPKLSLTKGGRVNQQPPALHEGWMVSGQETLFYWVPVWQRNMDLGFSCEEGCSLLLSWHQKLPPILSYYHAQENVWWGGFMLMITMFVRRSKRLGINVMFFCFIFVWWRMVWGGSWTVTWGYKRHWEFLDKLSNFGVFEGFCMFRFKNFFGCSDGVVWCELEFGVNAHKSKLMFGWLQNFHCARIRNLMSSFNGFLEAKDGMDERF
jgi:hypothetical protein